jgi:hypothetical protein
VPVGPGGRHGRPAEQLEAIDEVRMSATPVADREPEPRGAEEDQQDDQLVARVERHRATIPRLRPGD